MADEVVTLAIRFWATDWPAEGEEPIERKWALDEELLNTTDEIAAFVEPSRAGWRWMVTAPLGLAESTGEVRIRGVAGRAEAKRQADEALRRLTM